MINTRQINIMSAQLFEQSQALAQMHVRLTLLDCFSAAY